MNERLVGEEIAPSLGISTGRTQTTEMTYARWRKAYSSPRWMFDRHAYVLMGFLYELSR